MNGMQEYVSSDVTLNRASSSIKWKEDLNIQTYSFLTSKSLKRPDVRIIEQEVVKAVEPSEICFSTTGKVITTMRERGRNERSDNVLSYVELIFFVKY